ncbi:tetraacyldisaccharide 4'-kinase [Ferruginibacter yonginensis]|uniref:Tetraacyldisaccharide 4'-kinase n=1 Tax=Ferruginibacter yonginensis TaxID=1310416 RepID=A0ABV8QPC7_9BACT
MLKSFRYLLFPFSLIYGGIIIVRNYLFDKKIFKSASFNFPLICVGNLAVGGTGKTPMAEYLISVLKKNYQVATLSRGYKRKTKGYTLANERTTALEIGDEPMQFHEKFADISVAVGEERLVAIPLILQDKPFTDVIILDDAFQHRSVKAGLNILLTEYKNLYSRDLMMPAGDLRDVKLSSKRADIIVVTKCKPDLTIAEKDAIEKELKMLPHQKIFFTEIVYGDPYHLFSKQTVGISTNSDVLLITGIANPKPMKEFITGLVHSYDMIKYADHHIFTSTDLKDIKKHFQKIVSTNKMIITTEKDGVRLKKFEKELADLPIYSLPIQQQFLFNEAPVFNEMVINFIENFKKSGTAIPQA